MRIFAKLFLGLAAAAPAWGLEVASTGPCSVSLGAVRDAAAEDLEVVLRASSVDILRKSNDVAEMSSQPLGAGDSAPLQKIMTQCQQTRSVRRLANTARPVSNWVVADFNNDGRTDSLITKGSGFVRQMGQTDGTLGAPVGITIGAAGHEYNWAAAGDLNQDGKQDLVICCTTLGNDARLLTALGKGDGTFESPAVSLPGRGAFAVTDWNKDGKLDVVTRTIEGVLTVGLGQGDGAFLAGPTAGAQVGHSVVVTDATGDGRDDAIVLDSRSVVVHPGLASGGFGTSYSVDLAWNRAVTLAAADFTGDGKLDLAVTHEFGMTELLRGDPPLRFERAATFANQRFQRSLPLDLNDDGRSELLLPSTTGGGTRLIPFDSQGVPVASPVYRVEPSTSIYPDYDPLRSSFAVGDFDGDKLPDLAVAAARGEFTVIQVYRGGALSSLKAADPVIVQPIGVQRVYLIGLFAAEMTGDARVDLVGLDSESQRLLVFRNNGLGGFDAPTSTALNGPPRTMVAGDFNNDSRTDFAVALGGDNPGTGLIQVYYSNGTGGFTEPQVIRTGATPHRMAAADYNGDFKLDIAYIPIALAGSSLPAGIVLNRQNNEFLQPAPLALKPYASLGASGPQDAIHAGDVNGDGRIDLLIGAKFTGDSQQGSDGPLAVFLGDGKGGFSALPAQSGIADHIAGLDLRDLDGDGNLDLIGAHCCQDGGVRYYYGRADGTFSRGRFLAAGSHPDQLAMADLNGDDVPELIARTYSGVSITPLRVPKQIAISSAASGRGPTVAADSIVSAYGSNLAEMTLSAMTGNQTDIGGTRVTITDAQGRTVNAPLFFVSAGQVNFLIPAGLAEGPARVTLQAPPLGLLSEADITLARVAPGLFVVDATRLVAANVIRVKTNGQQIAELPYTDEGGLQGVPVDLGPEGETVVLVLYGTGLRGRTDLSQVSVTIGGVAAAVAYAGAQNEFPGLDQVNVTIPRSLAGRGSVDVVVTVEGQASNAGRILIR